MPNKIHYAYCLMKSDKKIALKSKKNAQTFLLIFALFSKAANENDFMNDAEVVKVTTRLRLFTSKGGQGVY